MPGEATISVSGGELGMHRVKYRVKRFPDPMLLLGAQFRGPEIQNGQFKAQGGLAAVMNAYDVCGYCDMVSFEFSYKGKNQDPVMVLNLGAHYNAQAQELVNRAQPGDVYSFDAVKVRCPGDQAARDLGSIFFRIK